MPALDTGYDAEDLAGPRVPPRIPEGAYPSRSERDESIASWKNVINERIHQEKMRMDATPHNESVNHLKSVATAVQATVRRRKLDAGDECKVVCVSCAIERKGRLGRTPAIMLTVHFSGQDEQQATSAYDSGVTLPLEDFLFQKGSSQPRAGAHDALEELVGHGFMGTEGLNTLRAEFGPVAVADGSFLHQKDVDAPI